MLNLPQPTHSSIGASSAERWWNCPGSVELNKTAPPQPPSSHAATGTVAHEIGEFYLRNNIPVDYRFLGDLRKADGFEIEVTEEMLDAVSVYVDYVLGLLAKHKIQHKRLKVEQHFTLIHIDPHAYGTSDAVVHVPWNKLYVIDYKHGYNVVDANWNKQTLYYALGAYHNLSDEDKEEIDSVETVIVQPRAPHTGGAIRSATYSIAELLEWEQSLFSAILRIRRGFTALNAGSWCRWCPSKINCPEARAEADRTLIKDFSEEKAKIVKAKALTPDQVSHVLKRAEFVKQWCNDVIEYAHQLAGRGVEIPGFKMVARRANRRWIGDKLPELMAETTNMGFDVEDIHTLKIKSPAQIEKLFKKHAPDFPLSEYWEKPDTGTTLVPDDDSRDAALTGAEADFADFIET